MNLGAALQRQGARVLVVDSDPQANLTSYLGGVQEGKKTLDELYLSKKLSLEGLRDWISETDEGVDLIGSDSALGGVDYYLFSRADRERVLDKFLLNFYPSYDFILIDTPPSAGLLTLNAMVAARELIIPVQAEFFSLEGIVKVRNTFEEVRSRWNPSLKILGILPSQVSLRRRLTQEVIEAIAKEFGDLVFETRIPDHVSVAESPGHARSVLSYDRSSSAAEAFGALAREILKR
jgi:chromosome partitioning protein